MNVIMHKDEKNTLPATPATPSPLLLVVAAAVVDNLLVALLVAEEEDEYRIDMVGCLIVYEVVGTFINILGACCFGFDVVNARRAR